MQRQGGSGFDGSFSAMFKLFSRTWQDDTIRALYGAIVAQARYPNFYADYRVPDTLDGRFEMIVLHLTLLVRRLRGDDRSMRSLSQAVFDLFCTDMDHSLREMGVGDLAVPKHMRRVGEAFYGRAGAYDAALDDRGDEALAGAIARNVFPGLAPPPSGARRLALYCRHAAADLSNQSAREIAGGTLRFPRPDSISISEEVGA